MNQTIFLNHSKNFQEATKFDKYENCISQIYNDLDDQLGFIVDNSNSIRKKMSLLKFDIDVVCCV
jgi:hypothetical protein